MSPPKMGNPPVWATLGLPSLKCGTQRFEQFPFSVRAVPLAEALDWKRGSLGEGGLLEHVSFQKSSSTRDFRECRGPPKWGKTKTIRPPCRHPRLECRKWELKRWGFKQIRGYLTKRPSLSGFPRCCPGPPEKGEQGERGEKGRFGANFQEVWATPLKPPICYTLICGGPARDFRDSRRPLSEKDPFCSDPFCSDPFLFVTVITEKMQSRFRFFGSDSGSFGSSAVSRANRSQFRIGSSAILRISDTPTMLLLGKSTQCSSNSYCHQCSSNSYCHTSWVVGVGGMEIQTRPTRALVRIAEPLVHLTMLIRFVSPWYFWRSLLGWGFWKFKDLSLHCPQHPLTIGNKSLQSTSYSGELIMDYSYSFGCAQNELMSYSTRWDFQRTHQSP